MMQRNIISFIFQNIGIYFLYAVAVFFSIGFIALSSIDISISVFSFVILATAIKIVLTYLSAYSNRLLKWIKTNKFILVPFIIFDIILVSIFAACGYGIVGFLLAITPCILGLALFEKIKNVEKIPEIKGTLYLFSKGIPFLLGFLALFSILGLFAFPAASNPNLFIFLSFLIIIFISLFENVLSYFLYLYFKLIKEFSSVVKRNMIISVIIDVVIYFTFAVYVLNNVKSIFIPYE